MCNPQAVAKESRGSLSLSLFLSVCGGVDVLSANCKRGPCAVLEISKFNRISGGFLAKDLI